MADDAPDNEDRSQGSRARRRNAPRRGTLRGSAAPITEAEVQPAAKPRIRVPAGSSRAPVAEVAPPRAVAPVPQVATGGAGGGGGRPPVAVASPSVPPPGPAALPVPAGANAVVPATPRAVPAVAPAAAPNAVVPRGGIPLALPAAEAAAPSLLGRIGGAVFGVPGLATQMALQPSHTAADDTLTGNPNADRSMTPVYPGGVVPPATYPDGVPVPGDQDVPPPPPDAPAIARAPRPQGRRAVQGSTGRQASEADRLNAAMLSNIDPVRYTPARGGSARQQDIETVRGLRQQVAERAARPEGYAKGGRVCRHGDGRATSGKTKGRFV